MGCSSWDCKESDTTEQLTLLQIEVLLLLIQSTSICGRLLKEQEIVLVSKALTICVNTRGYHQIATSCNF